MSFLTKESAMSVSADSVLDLAKVLKGFAPREELSLADYLQAIPRLESLGDVPPGTTVLVRGDVDAKPGPTMGDGDIRLRSMKETLDFGRQKGWKQVIFGHRGRKEKDKPIGSLDKVAKRLGEILGCEVPLITDWLDEVTGTVKDSAAARIKEAKPGSVLMLENARAYDLEIVLWKAKQEDLAENAPKLAAMANSLAEKIGSIYVNEALSAGSLDASSTIVPLAMKRVALAPKNRSET